MTLMGLGMRLMGRCRAFDSFLGSLVLIDRCRSSTLVDYMDMQVNGTDASTLKGLTPIQVESICHFEN